MILTMLPIEMVLALELTTNQNVMKGPCSEFVLSGLIGSLTVRQPMVQIYVFQRIFGFAKIWVTSCVFGKLRLSSLDCELKFE